MDMRQSLSDVMSRRNLLQAAGICWLPMALPGMVAAGVDEKAGLGAREPFELSRESDSVRNRYGMHPLGQNLLLARRLVESGVGYLTANRWSTCSDELRLPVRRATCVSLPVPDQSSAWIAVKDFATGPVCNRFTECGIGMGMGRSAVWWFVQICTSRFHANECHSRNVANRNGVRFPAARFLSLSGDFIGQSNSSEAVSGRVVEQYFVGCGRPDGGQLHGTWSVQDKLEPAARSVLAEFKFRHGKMVFKQIFFAAQSDMDK